MKIILRRNLVIVPSFREGQYCNESWVKQAINAFGEKGKWLDDYHSLIVSLNPWGTAKTAYVIPLPELCKYIGKNEIDAMKHLLKLPVLVNRDEWDVEKAKEHQQLDDIPELE